MEIDRDDFSVWLRNRGLKTRSIQNYLYYFDKFVDTYAKFNQKTVSTFLYNPKNVNSISKSFLKNLRWFMIENKDALGLTPDEYTEVSAVQLPKVTGRKKIQIPRYVPQTQIPILEEALPSEKEKLQLLLSFYCGLRVQEMCGLRKIDVKSKEWFESEDRMKTAGDIIVFGKGSKQATAKVPPAIMERLRNYIIEQVKLDRIKNEDDRIFVKSGSKAKLSSIIRTWTDKLHKAGIDSRVTLIDPNTKKPIPETIVNPHSLRHGFGTYLVENDIPIERIKEHMRHSDIGSTQIYLHISKHKLGEDIVGLYDKDNV